MESRKTKRIALAILYNFYAETYKNYTGFVLAKRLQNTC